MTPEKLRLVLCWHMHQPQYQDPLDGRWHRPWTWLHGIKDYTDMAAHVIAGCCANQGLPNVDSAQASRSLQSGWRRNCTAT